MSACTANLTSVRDFANTSFDATQYSQLVVVYVETPTRLRDTLSESDRTTLEDEDWSLLDSASDMITKAVGLTLDESQAGVARLKSATTSAQKAVKTLKDVRKVITVATASVGLAAAIVSKDPGAIAANAKAVFDAATASV